MLLNELMKYKKIHLMKTVREANLWPIDEDNEEYPDNLLKKCDLANILLENKNNNTTLYLSADDLEQLSEDEDETALSQKQSSSNTNVIGPQSNTNTNVILSKHNADNITQNMNNLMKQSNKNIQNKKPQNMNLPTPIDNNMQQQHEFLAIMQQIQENTQKMQSDMFNQMSYFNTQMNKNLHNFNNPTNNSININPASQNMSNLQTPKPLNVSFSRKSNQYQPQQSMGFSNEFSRNNNTEYQQQNSGASCMNTGTLNANNNNNFHQNSDNNFVSNNLGNHFNTNASNNLYIPPSHTQLLLEPNFNQVSTTFKNSNLINLHPWLKHLSSVGHTGEIKTIDNLNDFLIMRCISKHSWSAFNDNNDLEKYRCSLMSYIFSKLPLINLMSGRSLFKDLVIILDERLASGLKITMYELDTVYLEHRMRYTSFNSTGFKKTNFVKNICMKFNGAQGCNQLGCSYDHYCRSCYLQQRGKQTDHGEYKCQNKRQ